MPFNANQNNSANYTSDIPIAVQVAEPVLVVSEEKRQQVMTFDEPSDFLIKSDWFGGGNAEITVGPNNEALFQMVRMGGSTLCKTCELTINSMSGEQLLSMREHKYGGGVAMELCRFDPLSQNPNTAVPICRVSRNFCKMTIHNRYEVRLLGPMAENGYSTIDCNGHWPKSFIFEAGHSGEKLASVQKSKLKKWQLNVSAGEDVLLFIGIACAIDRLSSDCRERKAIIIGTAGVIGGVIGN